MERERDLETKPTSSACAPPPGDDLDAVRSKLEGILQAADKVLDSVQHVAAEEYLQQSRQRGAQ